LKVSFNKQQLDNQIKEMKKHMTIFFPASTWQCKCNKYEGRKSLIHLKVNQQVIIKYLQEEIKDTFSIVLK